MAQRFQLAHSLSLWICDTMDISSLLDTLQRCPEEIILSIFDFLPSSYISQFFLHYNAFFRQLVIQNYYSNELHVVLSPTRRPHHCIDNDIQRKELVDFNSYVEIDDFLTENPDINPQRLIIITGGDFRSLETLLLKYRDRFTNKISELQFQIEKYEPTISDLQLISEFRGNLTKLQFTQLEFSALKKSPTFLYNLQNLNQFVLLGHKIYNWSKLKTVLPPNLQQLDISWNDESNMSSQLQLPESVTDLYWNQAGVDDRILNTKRFPSHLKTLMLTYNSISTIDLGSLPQTLETIDLSYNCINTFVEGSDWPPLLRSILLSHNLINDDTLELLQSCQWPTNLKNLRLDNNPFTTLKDLTNLPNSIEYLDLSQTRLTSLNVLSDRERRTENQNHVEYSYFKFPVYLETLNLSNSESLQFDEKDRIQFPKRLLNLNLDECKIERLDCFSFPDSLSKLSLCGNNIQNLNSYEDVSSGSGTNSWTWSKLVNLSHLELYLNKIQTLENWFPPLQLKYVDLGKNQLDSLSMENTPIFQFQHCQHLKLQNLRLEINNISRLDDRIVLPPYLRNLSLKDNSLSGEINIPASFVNGCQLENLDLSDNSIEKLSFSPTTTVQGEVNCNLRSLNLTRNLILKQGKNNETLKMFYDDIENGLGLKVSKRKANVNSLHEFSVAA
ncbi:hypothetical protein CLIB1423_18S02938 [[Candida] railenensis]|uniref:F-box domain-containing protein n=1 Tax=[Candida] railenensis TaxID=45579 RepID=A0A9P0W088_9ASCO|nr:hypothetical protein CLIB1423_18S02938 [[Candida] railenensis]